MKKIIDLGEMLNEANNSNEVKNIYFVKMNEDDMIKKIGGTSHENRPFVVLEEIDNDFIKGCYTTSNLKGLNFSKKCFTKYRTVLSNKKYKLNKSSVVLIDKCSIISKNNVLRKLDSIDCKDLVKIIKMRALFKGESVLLKGKYLCEGDVIFHEGGCYLIYSQDSGCSYGLKIKFKEMVTQSRIDFRNTFDYFIGDLEDVYRIYYDNYVKILNNDKVLLCNHFSENVIERFKMIKAERRYLKKKTNKNKVKTRK